MYVASNGFKTAVITRDPDPMHPRDDMDNIATMVCWPRQRGLGDAHNYDDSHDFSVSLAERLVPLKNMLEFVQAGKASELRFVEEGDNLRLQSFFQFGSAEGTWHDMETCVTKDLDLLPGISRDIAKTEITDECYAKENLQMCVDAGQLAILPLFLYDHSMQSIRCESFVGRAHHAEWDSGLVGYIYMTKEQAMKELCNTNDKIHLSMPIHGADLHIPCGKNAKQDDILIQQGYTPVCKTDIVDPAKTDPNAPDKTILYPHWIEQNMLYKKDNYLFACYGKDGEGLIIRKVASFNPGLEKLTDSNWRERAEECMKDEVTALDNYLQGEVYGMQKFEGREEIDSCWSYYPGTEDIRKLFDDMFGDWGAELEEQMLQANYDPNENFDIDEYLDSNFFPDFHKAIQDKVLALVEQTESADVPWPYKLGGNHIRANLNKVLDDIVCDLYDEHVMPDNVAVHKAILENAGISRDYEPTISTDDLQDGKRYTLDELLDIVKQRGVAVANPANHSKFLEKGLEL